MSAGKGDAVIENSGISVAKVEEELKKTSKSPFDHQLSCFVQTPFKQVLASEKGKETDLAACVQINSAQLKVRLEILKRMKDFLLKNAGKLSSIPAPKSKAAKKSEIDGTTIEKLDGEDHENDDSLTAKLEIFQSLTSTSAFKIPFEVNPMCLSKESHLLGNDELNLTIPHIPPRFLLSRIRSNVFETTKISFVAHLKSMDPNENIPADKDADLQLCGSLPGLLSMILPVTDAMLLEQGSNDVVAQISHPETSQHDEPNGNDDNGGVIPEYDENPPMESEMGGEDRELSLQQRIEERRKEAERAEKAARAEKRRKRTEAAGATAASSSAAPKKPRKPRTPKAGDSATLVKRTRASLPFMQLPSTTLDIKIKTEEDIARLFDRSLIDPSLSMSALLSFHTAETNAERNSALRQLDPNAWKTNETPKSEGGNAGEYDGGGSFAPPDDDENDSRRIHSQEKTYDEQTDANIAAFLREMDGEGEKPKEYQTSPQVISVKKQSRQELAQNLFAAAVSEQQRVSIEQLCGALAKGISSGKMKQFGDYVKLKEIADHPRTRVFLALLHLANGVNCAAAYYRDLMPHGTQIKLTGEAIQIELLEE